LPHKTPTKISKSFFLGNIIFASTCACASYLAHHGIQEDKAIVTPNADTPYSWAYLDLRVEPVVLTIPRIEAGRYFKEIADHLV
jgi:hypothetical protein